MQVDLLKETTNAPPQGMQRIGESLEGGLKLSATLAVTEEITS